MGCWDNTYQCGISANLISSVPLELFMAFARLLYDLCSTLH